MDQTSLENYRRQLELEEALEFQAKQTLIEKNDDVRTLGELQYRESSTLITKALPLLETALQNESAARKSGKKTELDEICERLGYQVVACLALNVALRAAASGDRSYQDVGCEIGQVLWYENRRREIGPSRKVQYRTLSEFERAVSKSRKQVLDAEERLSALSKENFLQSGARVIELAIDSTGLIELQSRAEEPLLRRGVASKKPIKVVTLSLQADVYRDEVLRFECSLTRGDQMPMLIPPRRWKGINSGGYLRFEVGAIKERGRSKWHRAAFDEFIAKPPQRAFDALSFLQETAWRIDKRILESICTALNAGGDVARNKDKFQRHRVDALKRVVAEAQMIIDRLDDEPFYYVWQYCFRGRSYPMGQLLTPQGRDAAKALLRFAAKCPLGKHGRKWLAIYGGGILEGAAPVDGSHSARVEWIERNSDRICNAAKDPFGDEMLLWAGARTFSEEFSKNAWQGLQFCFEWSDMIASGCVFESNLPIAIDGTCNAVQHFAALTRDEELARKVNLQASELPSDVYATVAERVLKDCAEQVSLNWLSRKLGCESLADLIDRSICKTPVMTLPYGAQTYSRKQALLNEFRERYSEARENLETANYDDRKRFIDAVADLEKAILNAAEKELSAAIRAMDWLKEFVSLVSKENSQISWQTPAGFKVTQIYEKERAVRVKVKLRTIRGRTVVQPLMKRPTGEVDIGKAKRSISANFVHSLDGAHMMLVALAAKKAGIGSVRMVHDSFATFAGRMEEFSLLIRDTFVSMYEMQDPFQALTEGAGKLATELPSPPSAGSFNIEVTRQSQYFFS